MPWNDEILREAVAKAVSARGEKLTPFLRGVGISPDSFTKPPENGRRIDIFERLMPHLGWEPQDVLCIISRCFGWPIPGEDKPPSDVGRIDVVLRNVEIRVATAKKDLSASDATRSARKQSDRSQADTSPRRPTSQQTN